MSLAVPINEHVDDASPTDLYTAGADVAQLTTLVLTNTTASAITVSVWKRNAGGTEDYYVASDLSIPANGNRSISKGLVTFNASGEKLRAQASAVGIDAVGSIIEYA